MASKHDVLMEEIASDEINSRKRPNSSDFDRSTDKRHASSPPAKVISTEQSIRISLLDQNTNFVSINWIKACDFLNTVAKDWTFLAFGSEHRSVLLNGADGECVEKLESLKEIVIDKKSHPVVVEQLKSSPKKGIIYNRILTTIVEDQIDSELKEQGVVQFFRLQKPDGQTGIKLYTGSIILNFKSDIPSHIIISKIRIQVNHLTQKPMICFHCGILGHTRARCVKKSVNFCSKCYFDHGPNNECISRCKQCQGDHSSVDPSCPILIKELQILKVKESHGLSYFDAKVINESLNLPVVYDPLDAARLRVQELLQRNNFLFTEGKKQILEKKELMDQLKNSEITIRNLEEASRVQVVQHTKEIECLQENLEKLQVENQERNEEGEKTLTEMKLMVEKQEALMNRVKTLDIAVVKLKKEKINDSKQIEEFINTQEAIGKAFNSFINSKKNSKNYQPISLDIKITKRSASIERNCKMIT